MRAVADANKISLDGMRLVHTERTIPVEAEPVSLLKEYEGCSMSRAFQLLAEGEGDAFVSAGSTGALVVGGTFLIKRLPGIKRVALATQIPCVGGSFLLLDSGANHDCRPEMLQQFGIMGAAYMEQVAGVKEPRVGLVNIGSEETKGTDLYVQALNAAGIIEGYFSNGTYTYRPNNTLTRGQVSAIVWRMLNYDG